MTRSDDDYTYTTFAADLRLHLFLKWIVPGAFFLAGVTALLVQNWGAALGFALVLLTFIQLRAAESALLNLRTEHDILTSVSRYELRGDLSPDEIAELEQALANSPVGQIIAVESLPLHPADCLSPSEIREYFALSDQALEAVYSDDSDGDTPGRTLAALIHQQRQTALPLNPDRHQL